MQKLKIIFLMLLVPVLLLGQVGKRDTVLLESWTITGDTTIIVKMGTAPLWSMAFSWISATGTLDGVASIKCQNRRDSTFVLYQPGLTQTIDNATGNIIFTGDDIPFEMWWMQLDIVANNLTGGVFTAILTREIKWRPE